MASKALPSPEVLRQLLRYEPETGKLFWRERPLSMFKSGGKTAEHNCAAWHARNCGREALATLTTAGYRMGSVGHQKMYAHRAIMAMIDGRWPPAEVDHINGDPGDNRIENLRHANRAENCQNTGIRSNNTSGLRGVWFDNRRGKWTTMIGHNGRRVALGQFAAKEDAHAAYSEARAKFHGEFRREKCSE